MKYLTLTFTTKHAFFDAESFGVSHDDELTKSSLDSETYIYIYIYIHLYQ